MASTTQMPALLSTLPVLVPAVLVAVGWVVVLGRRSAMRWRMALLTASLAVFFLSLAVGLARYRQFGINVRLPGDLEVMEQLAERLRNVVSIVKLGAGAAVVHLLLGVWCFKQASNNQNRRPAP